MLCVCVCVCVLRGVYVCNPVVAGDIHTHTYTRTNTHYSLHCPRRPSSSSSFYNLLLKGDNATLLSHLSYGLMAETFPSDYGNALEASALQVKTRWI